MRKTRYAVKYTTGFEKDCKRAIKRGLIIEGRGAAGDGRAAAGEEPRSRFARRLGEPSGMSHPPGLTAHLPHRG